MEFIEMQQEVKELVRALNQAFQGMKKGTPDELRFQEYINTTLKNIDKAKKLDNHFYIPLERFYQASSLLIGLSSLKLDDPTYQAWRAYDRFHTEKIMPNLHLFANSPVM